MILQHIMEVVMHTVRKVTENLYSIGASDNKTSTFESFIPLQGVGMSYNSYLLLDEKTVLFDSVDRAVSHQFLDNLEYALDGRELDYIFVTHAEPDHSATIEDIVLRFPKVTILSSAAAIKMIKQFGYDHVFEGREEVVKDGDTRCFGKHNLTFVTAPMVHWPEVIMAFDTTSGVLFSSDAFGGFGAQNGALFTDEVDYEKDWLPEARRYYANIVVKQGDKVQALFKKLTTLLDQVNYICPIHGLVWKKKDIPYVLEKYHTWSKFESETQGVLIVYGSMYGNTENVSIALASRLREIGVKNVKVRDVASTHLSQLMSESMEYSHLVIACATYYLDIYPPMRAYLDDLHAVTIRNKTCALMYNGTWAPKAGDLLTDFLENKMQGFTLLEQKIHITSAARGEQLVEEIDALAITLKESLE